MALVELKPTSPGQRFTVKVVTKDLHKGAPHAPLTSPRKKHSGRNNYGRITVHHQGGGVKRRLRQVDFLRNKDAIPARVERIEYDPNRTAHLALLVYRDGERRYIIAPKKLAVGDTVISGAEAPIHVGNCLPMMNIPIGTVLHCVELKAGKGAQLARSAGAYVQLLAREGRYVTLRLRSGEMRKVISDARAVIGSVGNDEHNLRVYGKAGVIRRLGIRPTVRGVAKNPVDHPLGGGEGRTSGGRVPCNRKGLVDGKITRSRKKTSNRYIVRSRRRVRQANKG
jgi:large subunit ribosomal protein L2